MTRNKLTAEQRRIAKKNGIRPMTVYNRLRRKWTVEDAITRPVQKMKQKQSPGMYVKGHYISEAQLKAAAEKGITQNAIRMRMHQKHMSVEDALTKRYADFPRSQRERSVYTAEEIELAESNGITLNTVHSRVWRGWSKADAITVPVRKRKDNLEETDPREVIARIKHLNKTDFKDFPLPYPKTELRKLEAMNISVDDVEPIKA